MHRYYKYYGNGQTTKPTAGGEEMECSNIERLEKIIMEKVELLNDLMYEPEQEIKKLMALLEVYKELRS